MEDMTIVCTIVCTVEECGGYESKQYVQERSVDGMILSSMYIK